MGIRTVSLGLVAAFILSLSLAAPSRAEHCTSTNSKTPLDRSVPQWQKWEKILTSGTDYLDSAHSGQGNPQRDLYLQVTFTQCNGRPFVQYIAEGFWYGLDSAGHLSGTTFGIRAALPPGLWQWELTCHKRPGATDQTPDCAGDSVLNKSGRFRVTKGGAGTNPLYARGLPQVLPMPKNHYLSLNDKQRFFWLGDTVWSANILMNLTTDWTSYLADRSAALRPPTGSGLMTDSTQFTVLQMAIAPFAAGLTDTAGHAPFDTIAGPTCSGQPCTCTADPPSPCHRMNPQFWKSLDDKVNAANAKGLAVLLASLIQPVSKDSTGVQTLSAEAQTFAESVAARLHGNFVVLSPGFDHQLTASQRPIINAAGAGLKSSETPAPPVQMSLHHLATNHTAGGSDVGDYTSSLQNQDWLHFELFQSGTPTKPIGTCNFLMTDPQGHIVPDDQKNELCNLTDRAVSMASTLWHNSSTKPAINGESVYPGGDPASATYPNHTPYRARQTAYLSMLSGAAGYSMGTCGVIEWGMTGLAGCKDNWQWNTGRPAATATNMKILRWIFQSVSWESLMPEPGRIQPCQDTVAPDQKMVLASDDTSVVLAYLPDGQGSIDIDFKEVDPTPNCPNSTAYKAAVISDLATDSWSGTWTAAWLSPRNLQLPQIVTPDPLGNGVFHFAKPTACDPDGIDNKCDWILRITRNGRSQTSGGLTITTVNGPGLSSQSLQVVAQVMDPVTKDLSQEEIGGDGSTLPGPPQIATSATDYSMVVWQAESNVTSTISGRVLDPQGNPLTPEFLIASGTAAAPGHPSVAALGNGNFVVAWAGADDNRDGFFIRSQVFNWQGTPLAPAKVVADCDFIPGDHPRVTAVGTGGGYAIAWERSDGGGIYVLKADAAGNLSEAQIAVSTGTPALTDLAEGPSSTVSVSYNLYADGGGAIGSYRVDATTQTQGCAPPPLASDDAFTTDTNIPLPIALSDLLGNDAPGITLDHLDAKCPLDAEGDTCTYTPPLDFPNPPAHTGTDTFTYTVKDAAGNTGSATVTITVNRDLVANPDSFQVEGGSAIQITSTQLLANDSPGAVFVSAQNPVNGTLACSGSKPTTCTFTPNAGFTGTASFQYSISWDGNPPYATATVTIQVTVPAPQANFTVACGPDTLHPQDSYRTCRVHPTSTGALTRWLWSWGDGTPTEEPINPYRWADQSHTYAHSGRYTITHTVYDTAGRSSSVQLDVVPNTAPVAVNDTAVTDRDVPVTIPILGNDSDADGDALGYSVDMSAYPGASWQGVQVGNSWALRVTPPDSFVGTMTFTYVALDPWGARSAVATVTLTVRQWTVIVDALGEQYWCAQNGTLRIPLAGLLANDYDSAGDPLSIVAMDTSLLMGSLDCTSDPTACTYRPNINAYGVTLFRYTISDPAGHRDTATVRIYVGARGSAPTAHDDYFTTTMNTAKSFTIQDIVQNDVDLDGDTLTVGLGSGGRDFGSLSCTTPMYLCTYTPVTGYVGTDRFSYTAADGINTPAASAMINLLTLPPTTPAFDAREDVRSTGIGQQTYISYSGLTSNDYEPSGYPVTVTSVDTTGMVGGTLSCDSFGCLFQPNYGFQGTTRFRYTASNGHGASDTAYVKVWVGGTNLAPVAAPDTLSTPKNTPLRFSVFELLRNDYDPDNDPLTVTIVNVNAQKGTLSCNNPNYWCTYTPNTGATGADTFTYYLSDGTASVTSTLTLNILP